MPQEHQIRRRSEERDYPLLYTKLSLGRLRLKKQQSSSPGQFSLCQDFFLFPDESPIATRKEEKRNKSKNEKIRRFKLHLDSKLTRTTIKLALFSAVFSVFGCKKYLAS